MSIYRKHYFKTSKKLTECRAELKKFETVTGNNFWFGFSPKDYLVRWKDEKTFWLRVIYWGSGRADSKLLIWIHGTEAEPIFVIKRWSGAGSRIFFVFGSFFVLLIGLILFLESFIKQESWSNFFIVLPIVLALVIAAHSSGFKFLKDLLNLQEMEETPELDRLATPDYWQHLDETIN